MNKALLFLWLALIKRRLLRWLTGLRRPTTLVGVVSLAFLFGVVFHFRHEEIFGQIVRRESLIGGAMIMFCGSLFKGFLQRGLVFEPADVEFLFTGPFTQRQVVLYRLLPAYLYSVLQGLVFLVVFSGHLRHPAFVTLCLILFQAACFHISTGAAILAGTVSEDTHYRCQAVMLTVFLVMIGMYLRVAWGLRIVPHFVTAPVMQMFFYPASNLADFHISPANAAWMSRWIHWHSLPTREVWYWLIRLTVFAAAAATSLWVLLKLRSDIFEPALASTTRTAEKRLRLRQGRTLTVISSGKIRSGRFPAASVFRGWGAIIWKNLVVAGRSRRELMLAGAFALGYVGLLAALRFLLHHFMAISGDLPSRQTREFDRGLLLMLSILAFFLQRSFSFDFRREGNHLLSFRSLPISSLAVAIAEIAVPTLLCLAYQAIGVAILMILGGFDWLTLILLLLGFPAIALALNGVWNLHYVMDAVRRTGNGVSTVSPVEAILVVALSFLVFYPSGWLAIWVGRHTFGPSSESLAFGTWLATQYTVDFLLVIALAGLFKRFEVSRGT